MDNGGLSPFDVVLEDIAKRRRSHEPEDYTDQDGFLVCGKCNTRKQCDIEVSKGFRANGYWRVPIVCQCENEKMEAEKAYKKKQEFEDRRKALQNSGITDPKYLDFTFEQDDRRNPAISDVCRKYVENWAEMEAENIGILFYGDVGTGKSFLACCIANALLKKLVNVNVTNFPRILNKLQASFNDERQKLIDRLQKHSLLVIDDLGVERDTAYSVEQVYNVVDTRARAKKPLIVTTNLSMQELRSPPTLGHKRIYDRVLEMCPIQLKLVGESRRAENAIDKKHKARKLLGLE